MSTRSLSLALAAVLLGASLAPLQAQIVSGLANGPHHGPFIEPDTFRPDFQFFAPADATDYSPHQDANTGFFFMYDRLYLNVNRPHTSSTFFDGDFTWGNRLEMGFVTDEENGWGLVAWHINGNNVDRIYTPNLGTLPVRFDGTPVTLLDTLNKNRLGGVELNRIFKRQYFHSGGVLEPFAGLRYVKFEDLFTRSGNYVRLDTDLNGTFDTDVQTVSDGKVENNMLGAQVGCRIFKETGHWKLNTELRTFVMQNWQFVNAAQDLNSTSNVNIVFPVNPSFIDFNDQATVWGGELKMDAAYKITRDISINFGFVLMDFGKGVGRAEVVAPAFNPNTNNLSPGIVRVHQEDLFIGGLTFGFEVNR